MKKTLEELEQIRKTKRVELIMRRAATDADTVINVSAGDDDSHKIIAAVIDSLAQTPACHVLAWQTAAVNIEGYMPVMVVNTPNKDKVTYVNMTVEKVQRVMKEHIASGNVVSEFTYESAIG